MIKYHALIINSKCDIYGNRYFSMIVTNNLTGKIAKGKISGGESNCTYAMRQLSGNWEEFSYDTKEMPIREYNRLVKDFPYIGCTQDEIIKNVNDQWNKE